MNAAHFHLIINHLPVIGLFFGLGVLITGRLIGSDATMRAGLFLLVSCACFAIPAYLSGEPAEEIVERLPGVSEPTIEQHESAAAFALAGALLTGALSAAGLFLARGSRPVSALSFGVVAFAAAVTFGSMAWTAKLGGEIRHSELRSR